MLEKKESKNKKRNKSQLMIVGSFLLIVIGFTMIGWKYYHQYIMSKQEKEQIDIYVQSHQEIVQEDEMEESQSNEELVQNKEEFVAILEIPKIELKKGIYSKDSPNNNVDKNIAILKESDMPDIPNGNFILAGHSGTGYYAYFKNLKKLEKGDIVYIYYNASKYKYVLVDKYEIDKTGKALIVKNENDTAMTLITCKDNEDKQLIFIFSKEG